MVKHLQILIFEHLKTCIDSVDVFKLSVFFFFFFFFSAFADVLLLCCVDANSCLTAAVCQFRSASSEGLGLWRTRPLKDSACVVFEGESFRETSLTSSAVVKCDGLAFGAFPGCVTRCFTLTSRFLPPRPAKVTIYATRCRHFLSFFLLFRTCKESWDMWGHEGS